MKHVNFIHRHFVCVACVPPLSFLQGGCPSCYPTNSVEALKANIGEKKLNNEKHLLYQHVSSISSHQASHYPKTCTNNQKYDKHTITHNHLMALWILSGTTRVSQYQKKHSPTHTYRGHQSSLICFLHLSRSMASSLFNLRVWQSFSTISQVFFGLPLGLAPSTSYSILTPFFIQSLSSFRSTCPYYRNLFRRSTNIMSSNPSL